jgi:hypothetical protein
MSLSRNAQPGRHGPASRPTQRVALRPVIQIAGGELDFAPPPWIFDYWPPA